MVRLAGIWGGGLLVAALFAVSAAANSAWEGALPYVTQAVCAEPGALPFEPACGARRPAQAGPSLPWRKFDWQGSQASDSLLASRLGQSVVRQLFDFGDGPRRFGRMDNRPGLATGDGGDLIGQRGRDTAILMTEDGHGGVQWMQGPGCEDAPEGGLGGWLLFDDQAGPQWRDRVARLRITRDSQRCPLRYVPAYTRWRRLSIAFPWREGEALRPPFQAETIISEHYDGWTIARARHLERFWFARDLGKIRWERWEHEAGATSLPTCPAIEGAEPPGPGWRLADCRYWARFSRGEQQVPPWPAAE